MSYESFGTFEEHYHHDIDPEGLEDKSLFKTYMTMQVLLAEKYYGHEPSDETFNEWQKKNSAKFGEIMTDHPQLAQEFMHGDVEKALHDAAELLYEKHVNVVEKR